MQQTVNSLISRYGNQMMLVKDGVETSIRAFLQETRSKSMENTQRQFLPLGEVNRGMFVYIGPVSPAAECGDALIYQERIFEVRRAEQIIAGDEAVYCWGLCVEKGGDGTWGS